MSRTALKTNSLLLLVLLVGAGAQAAEPVFKIDHDEALDALRIMASMDIAAPPAVVWKVLSDCSLAPKIVPNMESCKVLQRDPAGRWELRETVISVFMLPRIRSVARNEFEPPRRLAFKRAPGGDMRITQGEWRLDPISNGKATRLNYHAEFATTFSVPRFLVNQAASRDVPTFFHNIEQASLADMAKR